MALVDKSVEACLAAIEVYNKPDFRYREEAFSILMLNAWELILKARVMREGFGKTRAIEIWEPRVRPNGTKTMRQYPKLNRSKNRMSIGVDRAMALVREYSTDGIDERCVQNLNLLKEVRDNSIHLRNVDPGLGQRIREVGSAALKNYVSATERWFGVDFSAYNFYLMPLAFHSPSSVVESLLSDRRPVAVRNLLKYIGDAAQAYPSDEGQAFNVTMKVELRFVRKSGEDALPVRLTRDPRAPAVQLTEEDILRAFPWDYKELTQRLRARYTDFVINNKFHGAKKKIETDEALCRTRYLNPSRPSTGMRKKFYSSNILTKFDEYYTRK